MKKLFGGMILILVLLFASCSDPGGATKFLQSQGYTDISITGYDFFAKGKDDFTSTGFTAITPNGDFVKGAVTDKGPITFRPRWNIRIWNVVKKGK